MFTVRIVDYKDDYSILSDVALLLREKYTDHNIGDLYINISDENIGYKTSGFYIVGEDLKIQELDYSECYYGIIPSTFYTFTRFKFDYFNLNNAKYINLTDSPIPYSRLGNWHYNVVHIEPGIKYNIIGRYIRVYYNDREYFFTDYESAKFQYDEPLEDIFEHGGSFIIEKYEEDSYVYMRI